MQAILLKEDKFYLYSEIVWNRKKGFPKTFLIINFNKKSYGLKKKLTFFGFRKISKNKFSKSIKSKKKYSESRKKRFVKKKTVIDPFKVDQAFWPKNKWHFFGIRKISDIFFSSKWIKSLESRRNTFVKKKIQLCPK